MKTNKTMKSMTNHELLERLDNRVARVVVLDVHLLLLRSLFRGHARVDTRDPGSDEHVGR